MSVVCRKGRFTLHNFCLKLSHATFLHVQLELYCVNQAHLRQLSVWPRLYFLYFSFRAIPPISTVFKRRKNVSSIIVNLILNKHYFGNVRENFDVSLKTRYTNVILHSQKLFSVARKTFMASRNKHWQHVLFWIKHFTIAQNFTGKAVLTDVSPGLDNFF